MRVGVEDNTRNLVGVVGHVDDITIPSALATTTERTLEAHL